MAVVCTLNCVSRDKQQHWRGRIPYTTLSTRCGNPEQNGPLQLIKIHLQQYTWKPKDSNLTISFELCYPSGRFFTESQSMSDPQTERQTAVIYSYLEFLWHLSVLTHRHGTIPKCPYLLLQWNICVVQDNWKSLSRQATVSNIDGNDTTKRSSKEVQ